MFSKALFILIYLLVGLGSIATTTEVFAEKISLTQRIGKAGLKSHCDAAGGSYGEGGGIHYCVGPGGDVSCSDKTNKCVGYTDIVVQPGAPGGATTPCYPIFCKIYCGGRPTCTFGTQPAQALRPEDAAPPGSLVTPVPGGGSGTPASSVPVLE